MSHVNITMTQTQFSVFFLLLSTLFVRGGVRSTMLNAVNLGLRPQTAGTQIRCFNYQISKTNNKSALDRDTCGKHTCWGIKNVVGKVFYHRPYVVSLTPIGYCYISAWMEEKSGISIGCFGLERFFFTVATGTRCACLMAWLNPFSKTKICSVLRWPSECLSPAFEFLIIFYES